MSELPFIGHLAACMVPELSLGAVVEYAVVGLLVLAAAGYAALRIRRALQGRSGCPFVQGGDSPCAGCPRACQPPEAGDQGAGERESGESGESTPSR
jgi:hypothetical protein